MEPRTTELPGEAQYFLDAAQECWELDVCSALTLTLYGDAAEIGTLLDRPMDLYPHRSHFRHRRKTCLLLAEMADTILAQLEEPIRAGLVCAGLKYVTHAIADLTETMAWWTTEDMIDGGCMLPFRHGRVRSRNGVTFKTTDRRLRSPKFIRRTVKQTAHEHADHLIELHLIMMRRTKHTTPCHSLMLERAIREQRDAHRRETDRRLEDMRINGIRDHATSGGHIPLVKLKRSALKRVKHNRKVIRRSLNVALALLGRETVSTFLRGEEIRLIGSEAMLVLRRRGSLMARGHGALSVAVAAKDGTTLADLCTYIEDTPTLDQLTGFALWMQAGEERKIIETANITRLMDGAKDHPVIAHHYKSRRLTLREDLMGQGIGERTADTIEEMIRKPQRVQRHLSHEERQLRSQTYWDATKGHWLEAMMVYVIGYRNFPIYRTAGAI